MRELLNRYLQKDRMLYNQIQTSASVTPVPESVSAKSSVLRGYTDHLEKSLNQLLIEDIQGNELPEQTQEQEERAAIPITHQQIVESHQSKQNLDLFEIKEDPTSARSSLARETVNKENNNILQNQELPLDEVQEVIDAEYQESDMSHSRSHRQPYVIAEKKSTSRLWKQAFEQPSRISVKDVKFLKPSRSNNPYDVSRRTTSNPASRDASPIFKGDRDGSFTISKPIIKEIPKPELQMDQSMRIVGKPARNVYELSPISTQRKLGEIWTQDGVKSAESFYSPANVSKMYDKTRKGGKSPTTANTSTISINNCTRNPTNYSFRANEANASKKNQVVGDASKRFKLPNESKPKVKAFAAHHEKERLKESLKQLKHSLMLES